MVLRYTGPIPDKAADPGRTMNVRAVAVGVAACASAALGVGGRISAHEPGDLQYLPKLDRFALAEAFRRGGAVERDALEAELTPIPGADENAVELGRDLDGDGDPDEIHFHLEVVEIQEEVYPGEYVTFWVFAPLGSAIGHGGAAAEPDAAGRGGRSRRDHALQHALPAAHDPSARHQPAQRHGRRPAHDAARGAARQVLHLSLHRPARRAPIWYHCHVQDHIHPLMGLAGMFIIEPNRPHNHFAHLIPGAGRITSMAKATREQYQDEYSLVYMDIDDRLNRIPAAYSDPREIEKRMHRDYDSTQRKPNIFMLNGRSFPFTMRDTPIVVKPDETTKLRILNVGAGTRSSAHPRPSSDADRPRRLSGAEGRRRSPATRSRSGPASASTLRCAPATTAITPPVPACG